MTNLQDFTNRSEVGTIKPWGKATAPNGYVLCDGTAISRTTYAELFAVISTTYGVGDALTNNQSVSATSTVANNQAVTVTGSISNTSVTEAQLASHSHGLPPGRGGSGNQLGKGGDNQSSMPNTNAAGSGTGHTHSHTLAGTLTGTVAVTTTGTLTGTVTAAGNNSFSPYLVVNYIIKH